MFCPKCGNQLPDDAKFCDRCGEVIKKNAATADNAAQSAVHVDDSPDRQKTEVEKKIQNGKKKNSWVDKLVAKHGHENARKVLIVAVAVAHLMILFTCWNFLKYKDGVLYSRLFGVAYGFIMNAPENLTLPESIKIGGKVCEIWEVSDNFLTIYPDSLHVDFPGKYWCTLWYAAERCRYIEGSYLTVYLTKKSIVKELDCERCDFNETGISIDSLEKLKCNYIDRDGSYPNLYALEVVESVCLDEYFVKSFPNLRKLTCLGKLYIDSMEENIQLPNLTELQIDRVIVDNDRGKYRELNLSDFPNLQKLTITSGEEAVEFMMAQYAREYADINYYLSNYNYSYGKKVFYEYASQKWESADGNIVIELEKDYFNTRIEILKDTYSFFEGNDVLFTNNEEKIYLEDGTQCILYDFQHNDGRDWSEVMTVRCRKYENVLYLTRDDGMTVKLFMEGTKDWPNVEISTGYEKDMNDLYGTWSAVGDEQITWNFQDNGHVAVQNASNTNVYPFFEIDDDTLLFQSDYDSINVDYQLVTSDTLLVTIYGETYLLKKNA